MPVGFQPTLPYSFGQDDLYSNNVGVGGGGNSLFGLLDLLKGRQNNGGSQGRIQSRIADEAAKRKGGGGFQAPGTSGGGGLSDLMQSALLQGGGGLAMGLVNLLRGPTTAQKSSQKVFNLAQNRLGQSVMDPNQYLAQYNRALRPQFTQQAEGIGKRLGFESGQGWGEMAKNQQSTLAQIYAEILKFNAGTMANRDSSLLGVMSNAAQSS